MWPPRPPSHARRALHSSTFPASTTNTFGHGWTATQRCHGAHHAVFQGPPAHQRVGLLQAGLGRKKFNTPLVNSATYGRELRRHRGLREQEPYVEHLAVDRLDQQPLDLLLARHQSTVDGDRHRVELRVVTARHDRRFDIELVEPSPPQHVKLRGGGILECDPGGSLAMPDRCANSTTASRTTGGVER